MNRPRLRPRAWLGPLLLVAVLSAVGAKATLANLTDTDTSTADLAADTLAPPTNLVASDGATIALSWTPSVETYTEGYGVYRASTSGGAYGLVGSVTPGTASSTTDNPSAGTWFYVLRSTYDAWSSVDSNEDSAIAGSPVSTSYATCSSNAADTSGAGDNNGYQTNPGRACTDDGLTANDPNSGTGGTQSCGTGATPAARKDRHRYWGYALGLPGTVSSIDGIRVRADLGMNNNGGTTNLCAQLSWDGGSTWTTIQSVAVSGTAQATYNFGSTSDTWSRTWTPSDFSTSNFRVRVIDASTQATKRFQLDYLAVSVTYRP
jgi:hypothetical protein